jgi:hypothetical protein
MTSGDKVTYFGETDARNKRVKFGIKAEDRTRHMYVIGKTGMGKSNLLENMAIQDIQGGEGICFIDPHGSAAEKLLEYVPENRIKDVVYFAPFDIDYPIAFNVMEDVGYDKRHLVVSGLMATFKKIWVDAWSARMEYILSNTLLALLEYPGATLLGVNKMYADKAFRKKVVDNISDPAVKSFWVDEYAKYTDKFAAEATPAIQNKIGQFTNNPLIRNIIGQPKSSFDIRKMMDERKILLVNLSKGRVGDSNANLLGAMLITKIYLAAMSRADASEKLMKSLPNFYLYVDEFQSFANESFADILSEARKYKLNLTIAHQYVEQMSEEVRAAVFGNVGSMIVFRVGSIDAEQFEKEFAPKFVADDIVNLDKYQMYLKLMIDGVGSQPFSARGLPPIPRPPVSYREQVVQSSRSQFGQLRSIAEGLVRLQTLGPDMEQAGPGTASQPTPGAFGNQIRAAANQAMVPLGTFVKSGAPRAGGPAPTQTSAPVISTAPTVSMSRSDMSRSDAPRNAPMPRRENRPIDRPADRPAPPPDDTGGFQSLADIKTALAKPRPQGSTGQASMGAAPRSSQQALPKKAGTEAARNDLRSALAGLVGPQKPQGGAVKTDLVKAKPASEPKAEKVEPKPEPRIEAKQEPKAEAPRPQAAAPKKEVPEDVLRKMLEV